MNCLTDKRSLSAHRDSDVLRLSSSLWSLVNKCPVSTKLLINQSLNAILILEKTSIATSLWAVEQLCSPVSLKDSVNKWLPWLLQLWKLKLLLQLRGNSWSGLVVQFSALCPPSKLCGLPKQNILRLASLSFIENASDIYIIAFIVTLLNQFV